LSNEIGQFEFYITKGYASSSLLPSVKTGSFADKHQEVVDKIMVNSDTIQNYCKSNKIPNIHLLKLDVQGAELKVLEGAKAMLANSSIQVIFSEVWFKKSYQGQAYFHDISSFLEKYDFNCLGIYNMHYDLQNNGQWLWGDAIFIKSV